MCSNEILSLLHISYIYINIYIFFRKSYIFFFLEKVMLDTLKTSTPTVKSTRPEPHDDKENSKYNSLLI